MEAHVSDGTVVLVRDNFEAVVEEMKHKSDRAGAQNEKPAEERVVFLDQLEDAVADADLNISTPLLEKIRNATKTCPLVHLGRLVDTVLSVAYRVGCFGHEEDRLYHLETLAVVLRRLSAGAPHNILRKLVQGTYCLSLSHLASIKTDLANASRFNYPLVCAYVSVIDPSAARITGESHTPHDLRVSERFIAALGSFAEQIQKTCEWQELLDKTEIPRWWDDSQDDDVQFAVAAAVLRAAATSYRLTR